MVWTIGGQKPDGAGQQLIFDIASGCENPDLPDREEEHDITGHCKINEDLSD
ncbi:MAG: hypothetical protein GY903_14095 [Fuerstiella sp.]|nr:hypothetical protein [Fuerstiella sp.]MCP4855618.1 hypothetical protein [Fuerstiella sp.]